VAALAVTAAPAHGAPGWSTAAVVEAGALGPTGLTFAADGTGVMTWEGFVQGHQPSGKLTALALGAPAGAWSRGPDLPGVTWGLARVHVVGSRTVMAGMRAYAFAAYNRARWEVVTATGLLDGSFGPVSAVARPVTWVGSAAGGDGEVLAAWVTRDDAALYVERLLPAPAAPRRLASKRVGLPTVAIGPRGHVLVAWIRDGGIEARLRTPDGHWGGVHSSAAGGPLPEALHAAVGADGRAIVAWGATKIREGEPGQWRYRTATTRSGERWATHALESFTHTAFVRPATALPIFDAEGVGRVAWTGRALGDPAVKIARADGTDVQAVDVTPPVAVDDVALARTGELAVVFSAPTPGQGPGPGPFITTAARGGRFGAAVDVGTAATAPLQGAKVAFDPVSGRPTVACCGAPRTCGPA
jgi:hypothetical protein